MTRFRMDKYTSQPFVFGWLNLLFGSFTMTEWALIIGMFSTIGGFLVTWYYKRKEDQRKEEESTLKRKFYEQNLKDKRGDL